MSKRNTEEPKVENVTRGPAGREGEEVFGVVHISESFHSSSTFFIHVTDLSCRETLVPIAGGMKIKVDHVESYKSRMFAVQDVAQRCKELGITAIHLKLHSTGGNKTKRPGPGTQFAIRVLARCGIKIGRIEDVVEEGCD